MVSRSIGATLTTVIRTCLVVLLAAGCALLPSIAIAEVPADRDGDKIFDSLDRQLGDASRHAVVVSLRAPASSERVNAIEDAVGDLGHVTRLRIVNAFTAEATAGQVRSLASRGDVAHVEENSTVVPFGVTAQGAVGVTRAREDIPGLDGNADGDPARYSKDDLVAAVIDSGIDTTMADVPPAKVLAFKDLVGGKSDPYDDLGHGGLVSAVLAGSGASGPEGRGVAPGAALVGVKVIDGSGQSSLALIAQGIQWAVENRALYGIDAINLSIGDPAGCGDGTDVASKAVDAAVAAGIVVVAAAGNAGPASCTVKAPGAAESALTVGAMADTGAGGFSQAYFSSRGPTADGRIKPDISAPGVNVVTPVPGGGYISGSGTSTAAPFMTGVALLMLQAHPGLTPAALKSDVETTAIDWGRPGRDNEYGYGRLDAYAALRAAGSPLAVPAAVPGHLARTATLAEGETDVQTVDITSSQFPLAVTMTGPDSGFDLSLRDENGRRGVKVVASDQGPGIADLERALTDGYTTGGGLGLGLPGARRLVDEFDIQTAPGEGTTVTLVKWARSA